MTVAEPAVGTQVFWGVRYEPKSGPSDRSLTPLVVAYELDELDSFVKAAWLQVNWPGPPGIAHLTAGLRVGPISVLSDRYTLFGWLGTAPKATIGALEVGSLSIVLELTQLVAAAGGTLLIVERFLRIFEYYRNLRTRTQNDALRLELEQLTLTADLKRAREAASSAIDTDKAVQGVRDLKRGPEALVTSGDVDLKAVDAVLATSPEELADDGFPHAA